LALKGALCWTLRLDILELPNRLAADPFQGRNSSKLHLTPWSSFWGPLQLCRYVEQGYLAIDNNLSERTLRVVALGRNNWGVLGSASGGKRAAVLYSVVQTCKHLGIDPLGYLREALPGLFALGEAPTSKQLQEWLPDRWLLRRSRDAPQGQTATG
jgi:transposase